MKNLFNNIPQEEKQRILEMHMSATKKMYLTESAPSFPINVYVKIKGNMFQVEFESIEGHRRGGVFLGKYRGEQKPVTFLFDCSTEELFEYTKPKTAKAGDTQGKVGALAEITEEARVKLREAANCSGYSMTGDDADQDLA